MTGAGMYRDWPGHVRFRRWDHPRGIWLATCGPGEPGYQDLDDDLLLDLQVTAYQFEEGTPAYEFLADLNEGIAGWLCPRWREDT